MKRRIRLRLIPGGTMDEGNDENPLVSLTRAVILDDADNNPIGWQKVALLELDRMRAQMPYADVLVLQLTTRRTP